MKKCATPKCSKRIEAGSKCHSCVKRAYKERHPIKYAYQVLRNNAKRRNKHFTLTFQQFEAFALQNDYINKKGISSTSLQVDRIDESQGYHAWNIQAISLKENVTKFFLSKNLKTQAPF